MRHETPAPLIDSRSLADYCTGHIAGATSLPSSELFERMHELPQRHIPLELCGDESSLAAARQFLAERQFTISRETVWTAGLAQTLAADGRLETGPQSRRLWEPSPLLQTFVHDILPHLGETGRRGVDLACGSGRDMVFLGMNGWHMLGIDDSADALERTRALARHNHVTVNTLQVDLEKGENPFSGIDPLLPGSADLVTVFRYLHRPLLPLIRNLLGTNGLIVYQTFMQGSEKFGSPRNPRFLLKNGELSEAFAGFDIIRDEIVTLADGRPVSAFIARKPG